MHATINDFSLQRFKKLQLALHYCAMNSEHAHCAMALCRTPPSWFCERCYVLWCNHHNSNDSCPICYELLEDTLSDPQWTVLCGQCNQVVKLCLCDLNHFVSSSSLVEAVHPEPKQTKDEPSESEQNSD
jgi:hypothetical protein